VVYTVSQAGGAETCRQSASVSLVRRARLSGAIERNMSVFCGMFVAEVTMKTALLILGLLGRLASTTATTGDEKINDCASTCIE